MQRPSPTPPRADPPRRDRRRAETVMAVLRRFSRLWGFLIFIVALLVLFRHIVVPFVFGAVVAYLLAPAVRRLQPKVGRAGAVGLIYLVIFGILALFLGFGVPALVRELRTLRDAGPELAAKFNDEVVPRVSTWFEENLGAFVDSSQDAPIDDPGAPAQTSELHVRPQPDGTYVVSLEGVQLDVAEGGEGAWTIRSPGHAPPKRKFDLNATLRRMAAERAQEFTSQLGELVQSIVTGLVVFGTNFVITFMLAAFILVDLESVQRFMRSLVPPAYQSDFDEIIRGVDVGMSGVIRGQLMICAVNGVLTYIGLLIFQVKYSLLLGLIAGAFSLVPIFGTIISSVPILLFALISGPEGTLSLAKCVAMLGWIAGIHLLEANFLNPKIIGGTAHIHPVVVVFALLAGEEVYGLTGALLAVPVASMVQTIFLYARRRSQVLIEKVRQDEARDSIVAPGEIDGESGSWRLDLDDSQPDLLLSPPDTIREPVPGPEPKPPATRSPEPDDT